MAWKNTTQQPEKTVEKKLVDGIKQMGGKAYKFTSPGAAGVPDRILVLPGGMILFCELKQKSGALEPLQRFRITEMRRLGCRVDVAKGAEEVNRILAGLAKAQQDPMIMGAFDLIHSRLEAILGDEYEV